MALLVHSGLVSIEKNICLCVTSTFEAYSRKQAERFLKLKILAAADA